MHTKSINMVNIIRKHFFTKQFKTFLVVGGTATVVAFFSRFLFRVFTSYEVSVALANVVGGVVSFILNKKYTFKSYEENITNQIIKFTLVGISAMFITTGIAYAFYQTFEFQKIIVLTQIQNETISHAISIGLTAIYNFFAMKYFSFKKIKYLGGNNAEG